MITERLRTFTHTRTTFFRNIRTLVHTETYKQHSIPHCTVIAYLYPILFLDIPHGRTIFELVLAHNSHCFETHLVLVHVVALPKSAVQHPVLFQTSIERLMATPSTGLKQKEE